MPARASLDPTTDERVDASVTAIDASIARILDGAFEQFCLLGIRRSSMEDVARRAGVARATLYRRFETKDDLVTALVQRETRAMVAEIERTIEGVRDPEARIVLAFVTGIRMTRKHRLVGALLTTEPETILPSLTLRAGLGLALVRTAMAEQVRRARAELGLPDDDAEQIAELVARVAHSLALTPETSLPLDDEAEAHAFGLRTIVPLVFGRGFRATAERPVPC